MVLNYHHVSTELIECIMSLYKDFATTIVTDSYTMPFLRIERGTLDIILLTKFGLNVIHVSAKHTLCQVSLWKKLATSENDSVKFVYHNSNISSNIQYSSYKSRKDVLKDTRDSKINKILTNLSSQSLIVKSLWNESFNENIKHWYTSVQNLPKTFITFQHNTSVTHFPH